MYNKNKQQQHQQQQISKKKWRKRKKLKSCGMSVESRLGEHHVATITTQNDIGYIALTQTVYTQENHRNCVYWHKQTHVHTKHRMFHGGGVK